MPSPPTDPTPSTAEEIIRTAALDRLRKGVNPFASQVAAVGTAEESMLGDVPEFAANQLKELLDIIGMYRTDRPTTRAYAVIGQRGAGKTHLFYAMRNELRRQAGERGDETLLVVVDRLSPGMDATDYLLWQIANHFLAHKGEGGRLLNVIAGRLTARLLGEALRQLAPHQKAELLPSTGFWSKLGIGSGKARAKVDAVDGIIQKCEAKHPTPVLLRAAVDAAGVKPGAIVGVLEQHLERTESNDVVGWLRRELYRRLARIALLEDREPFEELHMGGFEDARANVRNAGNLGRRLLETWLELLTALNIPVVVAFDQLEDYVNAPDPDQEKLNRKFFTDAAAKFINELKHVCILIFANETFWISLLNTAEPYIKDRLMLPIPLPGPSRMHLSMPDRVAPELVENLARRRIRLQFPDLDLTGLPPAFPFEPADIKTLSTERSIRLCLKAMAKRYDELLHKPVPPVSGGRSTPPVPPVAPPPPPAVDLKPALLDLWKQKLKVAKRQYENEVTVGAAFIPEVQNALDGWLNVLLQNKVTGSGPWSRVELVTNTALGAYGYLSVIRTEGRNAPGIGIAAWLGQNRGQAHDLKQRATFFKANPCPIKTLAVLRADLDSTLNGPQTREIFDKVSEKYDLRAQECEDRHMYALLAFAPWHQSATEEVNSAKESDPNAEKAFREALAEISGELLGWVDMWRQPAAVATGAKS